MKPFPKDLNQIMNSPEAAKLLGNKETLDALSKSPDVQKFMQMLQDKSGGSLQAVAEAAMRGDTSKLSQLVNEVSQNPEAAKAINNLNQKLK